MKKNAHLTNFSFHYGHLIIEIALLKATTLNYLTLNYPHKSTQNNNNNNLILEPQEIEILAEFGAEEVSKIFREGQNQMTASGDGGHWFFKRVCFSVGCFEWILISWIRIRQLKQLTGGRLHTSTLFWWVGCLLRLFVATLSKNLKKGSSYTAAILPQIDWLYFEPSEARSSRCCFINYPEYYDMMLVCFITWQRACLQMSLQPTLFIQWYMARKRKDTSNSEEQ